MSRKVCIFVEGKQDSNFLKSYVGHLGYELPEIIPIGGKDNLKGNRLEIAKKLDEEDARVLIIFDADDDYGKTKYEAKRTIQDKVQVNDGNSRLDFFLFPNNQDSGNLEDLLEKVMKPEHQGVFDCFEAYKKCLGKHDRSNRSYVRPNKKAKIYAYKEALGAMEKGKNHFSPKYWEFENSSLDPLKSFLCENFRKSGLEKVR